MIRLPKNILSVLILVTVGVLVSIVIAFTLPVQYAFERLFTRSMK
jgi:hypothetical protein